MTSRDAFTRTRIRESLGENLLVEAGAGTGKTSLLVDRVVNLIVKGKARIEEVAAITFTEAAASELSERVRGELEKRLLNGVSSSEEEQRLQEALQGLELASIQTIHGFARSLLAERALDAGLPLLLEVLDSSDANMRFEREWNDRIRVALDEQAFLADWKRADRLDPDIFINRLRDLSQGMRGKYHLLKGNPFAGDTQPVVLTADPLLAKEAEWRKALEKCNDSEDGAYEHLIEAVLPLIEELRQAGNDPDEVESILVAAPRISTSKGRLGNWERGVLRDLKSSLKTAAGSIEGGLDRARSATLSRLAARLLCMTRGNVESRRSEGVAEFDDLLVWARDLLRDNPSAREHFQDRYKYLLVDEFQDTDPLQIDIVKFLTCCAACDRPAPGSLFVVGDPKQSIYGFRRADLRAYGRFKQWFQESTGLEPLPLTLNHRSHPKIIAWVNQVLKPIFSRGDFQAKWEDLEPWLKETDWPSTAAGHRVLVFGDAVAAEVNMEEVRKEEAKVNMEDVRKEEADTIARLATEFGAGRYEIRDMDGAVRSSDFRDLAILFRSRTGLEILERALARARVPYLVQGESEVFDTQEFRDLANCLTAINDPTDQPAIVGALRSPAFGCSDVELWEWAKNRGKFSYVDEPGATSASGMVGDCLLELRKYHGMRDAAPLTELVEGFVRDRQLREIAALAPRPQERLRRIDLFIELARQRQESDGASASRREESVGASAGEFVVWLAGQRRRSTRMIEAAPSAVDENSVQLMTIHSAKGLEFPAVVIAGLGGASASRIENVIFDSDPKADVKVAVRAGKSKTIGFDELREGEKSLGDAEDDRLLYVAATRARDYLFPSLFRKEDDAKSHAAVIAEQLEEAEGLWECYEPTYFPPASVAGPETRRAGGAEEDVERWSERREKALAVAARSSSVRATDLHQHELPPPLPKERAESLDSDTWLRGRAATRVGRAVHAVLEVVDLATGYKLKETAKEQAAAHGVSDRLGEVIELARGTLQADVVRQAARSGRCWREVPVAASLGEDKVLEGVIDLIFETKPGELVIVDYKTDEPRRRSLEEMGAPYVLQIGAYASAVERNTPARVVRAVLVFPRFGPQGEPGEFVIPDLEYAKERAMGMARGLAAQV